MKRPTKATILKLLKLKQQKSDLERRARALEPNIEKAAADLTDYLKEQGKDSLRLHNHQITITDGRVNVKWKDELAKRIDAAEMAKITADTPKSKVLVIVAIDSTKQQDTEADQGE